uniref:zinc finger protein 830 n=1 Tax=Myxine glutinosa TaxID=7769 RepID=UPI0035902C54
MAASGRAGKKVLKQEELRRLMREKQRQAAPSKRIDHPFAKYNSIGQLLCTLCSAPIKNEALWQTHVLGRQHKERFQQLKTRGKGPEPATRVPEGIAFKRKATDQVDLAKKTKEESDKMVRSSGLPSGFFDPPVRTGDWKGVDIEGGDDNDVDGDDDCGKEKENEAVHEKSKGNCGSKILKPKRLSPSPSKEEGLPADFFDGGSVQTPPPVIHSGSVEKAANQDEKTVDRASSMAETLPEGFFDDPVMDAKVRKVDLPKDQMEKEWEEFQKEMRQQNTVSDAIVDEEDEEGRVERRIDETDEQIQLYRRVESLRDRQDGLKDVSLEGSRTGAADDDYDYQDEEAELHSFLSGDWRAKGALL